MRMLTLFSNNPGWLVALGLLTGNFALAQNGTQPNWYAPDNRSAGVVQGFGSGDDFSTAVFSALSDLARYTDSHIEGITTESKEGFRETSRQEYGTVLVIDTLIVMGEGDEDQMTHQTQIMYQDKNRRYLALQTLTSYPDNERGRWQIIADNCGLDALLDALQSAGIDIKKQVVPNGAGYQFYVRMRIATR